MTIATPPPDMLTISATLTQQDIQSQWHVETDQPIASIVCHTYNQGDNTRYLLEGMLAQKTSFPFEILIYDAVSTDNTRDIIGEYAERFPDVIRTFLPDQPDTSRKPTSVTYAAALGQYIAICSPDGYWIDENKLEKQIQTLQLHGQVNIAFHPSRLLADNEEQATLLGHHGDEPDVKDVSEPASHSHCGHYAYLGSFVFRSEAIKQLPRWFFTDDLQPVTYFYETLLGHNGMLYTPEPMTAHIPIKQEFGIQEFAENGIDSMEAECARRIKTIGYLRDYEHIPQWALLKSMQNIRNRFLMYSQLHRFQQSGT